MRQGKGFTLVEILIVVVLLGVMAAIVIPAVANCGKSSRETTLSASLKMLRTFVLVYTSHHLEVAPGYPDGNRLAVPTEDAFIAQAMLASTSGGETAAIGTPGYDRGPYLSKIPKNPFNNLDTVQVLANGAAFPAAGDDSHGWIYKPLTGEIRPGNSGSNDSGELYYEF